MDAPKLARKAGILALLISVVAGCETTGPRYPYPQYLQDRARYASDQPPSPSAQDPNRIVLPEESEVPPALQPVVDYLQSVDEAAASAEHASASSPPSEADIASVQRPPANRIDRPAPAQPEPTATPPSDNIAGPSDEQTTTAVNESADDGQPAASTPDTSAAAPMVTGVIVNERRALSVGNQTVGAEKPATANDQVQAAAVDVPLEKLLAEWADTNADESFRGQLDRRLVHILAGEYERARQPLEMVTKAQQELASRFIEALIAVRELHLGNLNREAGRVLAEIRPIMDQLSAASDLSIPRFVLCSRVDAFGNYQPLEPAHFETGRPIAFVTYAEVENLVSEKRGEEYCSELSMVTTVYSDAGESLKTVRDGEIVDRCRNRRQDFFVAREIRLPATFAPGAYVVKVTITDKLGQKVAENRATLKVIVP